MNRPLSFRNGTCLLFATVALAFAIALSPAQADAQGHTELSISGTKHLEAEAAAPEAVSKAKSGGICKAGFDIRNGQYVLESSDFLENDPAAVVKMKKPCHGAVVVRFATAVTAPTATDVLYLQAHAKCLGPGGYANGCTKGEDLFGFPGHYGLDLVTGPVSGSPVHSTQWIYADLKPGVWKFIVYVGRYTGEGVAIEERSLTVDAYKGG